MSDNEEELVHLEMGLRAFSQEPECPKCLSTLVKTAFHSFIIMGAAPPFPCDVWMISGLLTVPVGEHLCRWCTICEYGWPEQVADA